jgi:hypothetical protein
MATWELGCAPKRALPLRHGLERAKVRIARKISGLNFIVEAPAARRPKDAGSRTTTANLPLLSFLFMIGTI